jgi:nucleotide-binding universal stress UspA family protein
VETVLVGYDGSDAARGALAWATDHARAHGGEVLVVKVVQDGEAPGRPGPAPDPPGEVPYRTRTVTAADAAEAILGVAREEDAAVIAVGSTDHGRVHSLVEGSVTRRILGRARRPVVAVPAAWSPTPVVAQARGRLT